MRFKSFHAIIILPMLALVGLLVFINWASNSSTLSAPSFSYPSGFYDDEFDLTMESAGGTIYYTLDSTDPDENSYVYTEPIHITDATSNPNVYSMIEDADPFSKDALSEFKEIYGVDYQTPDYNIDKCTVVRAVCIDKHGNKSDVTTASYFVGFGDRAAYDEIPILSIVTDPYNLFDSEDGIYVTGSTVDDYFITNPIDEFEGDENSSLVSISKGKHGHSNHFASNIKKSNHSLGNSHSAITWQQSAARSFQQSKSLGDKGLYLLTMPANFNQRGSEWTKLAHVTCFNAHQAISLDGEYDIKIQGSGSRLFLPRSFFIEESEDSASLMNCLALGFTDISSGINISNGGDSIGTKVNDFVINNLASGQNVVTREYIPCEMFLDGEYWGTYIMTVKLSPEFFANKYGIDAENLEYIKNGEAKCGDTIAYDKLYSYVVNSDMSDPDAFDYFCQQVDLSSCIDYYANQTYVCNTDWPTNNYAIWRVKQKTDDAYGDTRWRFVLFDVNCTLSSLQAEKDNVPKIRMQDAFFDSLMNNATFASMFYDKMIDLATNVYTAELAAPYLGMYLERMDQPILNERRRYYGQDADPSYLSDQMLDVYKFFVLRRDFVLATYNYSQADN